MLARPDTKVRSRFCVKRCGPSRRRVRTASAVLKNFVRQPEKTFATISAQSGHAVMSELSPLCEQKRTCIIRRQSQRGLIPPPASPHSTDDTMAKILHAGTPED